MTTPNAKPRAGEHTKGPWMADRQWIHESASSSRMIAKCVDRAQMTEANARRIVACVNACEGIPTELMEQTGAQASKVVADLQAERDLLRERERELLQALEVIDKTLTQAQTAWTATRRIDANRASARRLCYDAQARSRAALAKHGR